MILMISDQLHQTQQLEGGGRRDRFCFPNTIDHKGLMSFLFGIHIYDQAGLAILDSPQYDSSGMIDQGAKDREKGLGGIEHRA